MRGKKTVMRRGRRKMKGGSIMGWIRSANNFLRKHKVLSTAGSIIGKTGLPYSSQIGTAGKIAGMAGYGRRMKRGRGVIPTGGMYRRRGKGLRLAGSGNCNHKMR